MTKKKLKTYRVKWDESRCMEIKASSKEEAIEKVMEGQGRDRGSEMVYGPDAFEIDN